MRKHLAKRILCLCLAATLIAANIIPAIAARRADVYGSGNLANYTFENGASVAAMNPNGACTGLAWEETDVKPLTGYVELGGSFWYGKHWASAKKPVTAAVSLRGEASTKISVDFNAVANTYLTCILPHFSDVKDTAVSQRGCQLFANCVYLPTENRDNYPDYIKAKYEGQDLKFYYYLFALIQSCPFAPPTASTLDDAVADTYKSMMAFAYSRCLEEGDLKGGVNSSPASDWNIVKNKLGDMYSAGVPAAWSQMCTAGANDFQKYWEIAAFLSCLSVAYDGAGGVDVILPLTVASQGSDGRWHMTFDYSSYNEYAKKYLQKITSAGSSKLKFVNNGSSIDISADSEADIKDTAELASIIMNSADLPQAPILCVEMQPIGVEPNWANRIRARVCGQPRFAVTYMPLNIGIIIDPIPPSGGETIRYEHLETFTATYNIAVNKYDSETGQGLKGVEYRITHTHDSSLLDDENWDENTISDDCVISGAETDNDGVLTGLSDGKKGHTDVRTYSYHKGYCGGHSVPAFVEIPEEEEDEDGNITNEGEIEAAKAQNDILINGYFADVVLCCEMENEGGYFCKADEAGYSSSSTPVTGCESKEEYESQCANIDGAMDELEADRDEKYSEFISITYTYKVQEISAKAGYSLHGVHNDDIPLEIKKVWSSEYMDGAVRVSAISTKVIHPSAIERMFGVMTAYAAEQDIAGPSGRIEITEEKDESASPEITGGGSEVSSDITSPSPVEEITKDSGTAGDSIEETEPQTGEDDEIPEDGEIGTPSEAEAEEIENATPSETGEIDSILAAIDNVWESLLEFIKGTANGIKDKLLLAAAGVGDFFAAPLMTFGLLGAGGSSSGGTVTTSSKASWQKSELNEVDPADNGIVSHTWIIFDHRTEGEIHLTKRDLNLSGKENTSYDSYGDSNGDGTLEGAVYGLFAAQDIVHPDGHTGVVYYKDELTAIATTDRNGDISFTAYTEAPGYVYSYTDGSLIKDPNHAAFTGPFNMHRTMGTLETRHGTEKYIGHTSKGSAVTIADYETGGGDYYYKVSSNQSHIEGITRNGSGNYRYPIYNNELNNGNCWIGRPLIVGESCASYYIKELTRSEGYELSVSGKQNLYTNGKNSYETGHAVYVTMDNRRLTKGEVIDKLALTVDVTAASDTAITDDIRIKVTGVSANINAALSATTTGTVKKIVAIPKTSEETVISTDGLPVILSGTRVEVKAGDIITTSSGTYTVNKVSDPEIPTTALLPTLLVHNTYPTSTAILSRIDSQSGTDEERLVAGLNEAFKANAFPAPSSEAPWIRADISGAATMEEKVAAVLTSLNDAAASYATRVRFELHDGVVYIRYDHYDTVNGEFTDSFCDITTGNVYLKMDSGKGYFVYVPFTESDAVPGSWVSSTSGGYTYTTSAVINSAQIDTSLMPPKYGTLDIAAVKATLIPLEAKTYWLYDGIMPELNDDGSIRKETKTRTITDADPEWGSVSYEGILWKYIDDPVEHEAVTKLSIVNKDGAPVSAADEDAYIIIPASVYSSGDTVTLKIYDGGNGNYTPSLSTVLSYVVPDAGENSYIVNATLEYPGSNVTMQSRDAISGKDTIREPLKVYERPIRQKVRLSKDISLNADMDSDGTGDSYRNNTYDVDTEVRLTNFRFKAYLKSNLERLYRDENGNITWLDRNGNEIRPVVNADGSVSWKYLAAYSGKTVDYPEEDIKTSAGKLQSVNVNKIYTKVFHNAGSLTFSQRANNVWNSYVTPQGGTISNVGLIKVLVTNERTGADGNAVTVNTNLYSYDGKCSDKDASDKINAVANIGFTRILEMKLSDIEDGTGLREGVETYDYGKFFDAIAVANGDKWDDAAPTYSSYKPIGNKANRSTEQIENAKRSDRVRQFAITYYLEDEVSKLVTEVPASSGKENEAAADPSDNKYQEQIYDKALNEAIKKAEDYLAPFFKYDLDAIYAVDWDSETDGGKDGDVHTLSLDTISSKETSAVSAYLPYGEYVIAEEQPRYSGSSYAYNDVLNKRYKIDEPKEIKIPSLYEGGSSGDTNENYDSHYKFVYGTDLKDMSKSANYLIRFGEEWNDDSDSGTYQSAWVIRAHSDAGDFEVYKYGLDADRMDSNTGKAIASKSGGYSYYGLTVSQDSHEPLKDYYNTSHLGTVPFGSGTEAIGEVNGGNDGSRYYIDSKAVNNSVTANGGHYKTKELKNRLYYGAVSEDKGTREIISHGKSVTEDNRTGMEFKTVTSMTGSLTAYDGEYASMLVPWTVTEGAYSSAAYTGYADKNIRNEFYSAKLRLEKLDSETHEPILHDDAAFSIYKAAIDASTGYAKFYEADTTITGSKEFVESYCEKKSAHPVDSENPRGQYEGTVKAGTPVCLEADQVILGDRFGNQVSEFKAFSTMRDIGAKAEMDNTSTVPATYMFQNTGYLETPQALGAGAYVILEKKVPSGYVRTKPLAIEIYTDKVTYYKEGNKDERVVAAVYEYDNVSAADALSGGIGTADEATEHGNKIQDTVEVAQVYVEDMPIKLTVEKVKESSAASADTTVDKSVSYKVSGRVEGSLSLIGERDDLEYVYSESGRYLGYAYYKGTLEYLAQLKKLYDADADPITHVDVVYTGTTFAGYGYVTRPLLTADDDNKYVVNARLTMFDALQLRRNDSYEFGKSDYAFSFPDSTGNHGLIIERDINSNIKRMYVEEGYAGTKTQFLPEVNNDGTEVTAHYLTGYKKDGTPIYTDGTIYDAEMVERFDTDILHYDLNALSITWTETEDSISKLYGYDKNKVRVDIKQLERDKALYPKTDNGYSIYAFSGSLPVFEITGGDLTKVSYDSINKRIKVADGTVIYHLDTDGNRDSMVDPYTGMAYVIEQWEGPDGTISDKWMVWAVEVYRDEFGNVISQDKITTSRIATVWENIDELKDTVELKTSSDPNGDGGGSTISTTVFPESGSTSGSWHKAPSGTPGGESHHQTSDRTNNYGQNMNGQVLVTNAETDVVRDASKDFGDFYKEFDPVYDPYGNIYYYQRSDDTYDKGSNIYDRNGDFVRYDDTDDMEEYNRNAYRINDLSELYDMDGITEDGEPSSSKLLYHRFGEGYVLQNTWLTSDKTPNDPFRFTQTDGQADILKRVPEGNYIIEEVYTPTGEIGSDENGGYIKAFPVPVTVNEDTQMHYAKMVDHTTKIEIVKLDTPNDFSVDVIAADTGDKIGDYLDEKSSYSFGLVEGAQLTLYEAKKVYSSDYEKYPKGYYLVKKDGESTLPYEFNSTEWKINSPKTEKMQWTTSTDKTIYVEGLPQGYYILEETITPEGFLKAPLIGISISSDANVKEVMVKEDHTKVEIEKVFFDENTPKALGGARFELHEAKVDGSGNVIYDSDGEPEYEPTALLSWTTSDGKEWTNLEKAFADMFEKHGIDGTTFSYVDASGLSHTLTRTSIEYTHDASLQAGPLLKYPTDAREIFEDGSGRKVVCSVFQPKAKGLVVTYQYDFEYDFCEMPAVNDYAHSYTTASGTRRFNYLPVGKKYVAVEAAAPEGFTLARPKLITVDETENIQRYIIEDTKAQLIISKMIEGKDKEYEGAVLALYRAEGTSFVEDEAHLVEKWISGTDGRYDDNDLLYGRIWPGYVKGDLRPHKIEGLAAGNYYLVEVESPYYYKLFDPVFIDYTDISEIKLVRQYNCPIEGRIVVHKQDEESHPLDGAVYRIRAYKETDMINPVSDATYTAIGSDLVADHLPVGEADSDGNITPYTYTVREVVPPKGYSAMNMSYIFTFMPRKSDGKCYESGDVAVKELTFTDALTKFRFEKKDFKSTPSDALYIEGATIALYEMTGTDADGDPLYDPSSPIQTIDTHTADGEYEIEGLEAGKSYVFVETNVPDGYNPMIQPLSFTVSPNGRSMTVLGNKLNVLSFETVDESDYELGTENIDIDSIKSAKLTGRYVVSLMNEVTDKNGVLKESWPGGMTHIINIGSGYTEDEEYTITEKLRYSDGTVQITDVETVNFHFDKNGNIELNSRDVDKLRLAIYYGTGEKIDEIIDVTSTDFEKVIENGVVNSKPVITLTQAGGEAGDPLRPGVMSVGEIRIFNPDPSKQTADVEVTFDEDTALMNAMGGEWDGTSLKYTVDEIPAFGSKSVMFLVDASGEAATVTAKVQLSGKTLNEEKKVPLVKPNKLTVYNELIGSGKSIYGTDAETFKIRLWSNDSGSELAGEYSYTGSKTGTIKSGDEITLKANEYAVIDTGVYSNVHYTVVRTANGRVFASKNTQGDFTDAEGAFARFTRSVIDTSDRAVFRKGEAYTVKEFTSFTDGIEITTNRLEFTLGDNGGVSKVTAFDLSTKVAISKVAITGGEEIPNTKLTLYDLTTGEAVDSWTTTDVPHIIEGLLVSGRSYRLEETKAADGWGYTSDVVFAVDTQGYVVQRVKMVDEPTIVKISKKDIAGAKEIPGCKLQVIDKDGNIVEEWISGITPHEIIGKLVADETYTLREIRPDDGWAYAEDITFTVEHDGGIVTYAEMRDKPTHVEITKTDITGAKEIPGCKLQVIDKDGNIVEEWISGTTQHIIEGKLIADETYRLVEKKVADDKALTYAEDILFTVSHNGSIDIVIMKDDVTDIDIVKKNTSGEMLPGVKFRLFRLVSGGNRELIEEWVTGDSAQNFKEKLEVETRYIISEVETVSGYSKLANDIMFILDKDGTFREAYYIDSDNVRISGSTNMVNGTRELTVYNAKAVTPPPGPSDPSPKVIFRKYEAQTNKALAGAEFTIYEEDKVTIVGKVVTDETGHASFELPYNGMFYYLETKAPAGYEILTTEFGEIDLRSRYTVTISVENKLKIGYITANFDRDLFGLGKFRLKYRGSILDRIATGDNRPIAIALILAIVSALGLAGAFIFSKKKKGGKSDEENS